MRGLLVVFALFSGLASADIMWGPSPSQTPPAQKQDSGGGWGDLLGGILKDVITDPGVVGAGCAALPESMQRICAASLGDPAARQAAYTLCGDATGNQSRCMQVASDGIFTTAAVSFCGDLIGSMSSSTVANCLEGINGKVFDSGALAACGDLIGDSGKMSCIDVIANRAYEPAAVAACADQVGDARVVGCLRNTGF